MRANALALVVPNRISFVTEDLRFALADVLVATAAHEAATAGTTNLETAKVDPLVPETHYSSQPTATGSTTVMDKSKIEPMAPQ